MLTCKREEFSLPDDLHYLNCAYMGPISRRTEEAGIEGVRRKRNPAAISAADFFTGTDQAREGFARLVGAREPGRVAVIPAVSYGMAIVARNTPLRRGQNVVVAEAQFPSNVYAWRRLCADAGGELRTVRAPVESARRGEEWNARLLEAVDGGTALVALPHVHWADGTRFDLEAVGARAREVGAALVVDGTQSIGALPFDLARIRPDALVCAGYKWLLDYADEYAPGSRRFDVGEGSNFALMPMLTASMEQVLEWGAENVQAYCRALTGDLVAEAASLGYVVEDEAWRGAHLFGLRLPAGVQLPRLQALLRERNVAVSLRGDAVRVSPNVYNDARDVDALREVLREAVG